MILKKIDEKTYEDFVENSNQASMYQSISWYKLKKEEGKKIELLGLFDEDNLVGVSLVIYLRVLKKYYIAYATRGFVYDYKEIPNFKNSFESKDSVIKKWLTDWIKTGVQKGRLQGNSLLPKKQDLAYYLGVSVGTIQNAIRFVEDAGFLESKQRIGTIIRLSLIHI